VPSVLTGDRRKVRIGLRVIHDHRVGNFVSQKESELVFVRGRALALPGWVNLGGVRTPLYVCELDTAKLRVSGASKTIYYYDGVTVDPRFELE
jgi:hypothetical protein